MDGAPACPRCGEALELPVSFCPFCGLDQATARQAGPAQRADDRAAGEPASIPEAPADARHAPPTVRVDPVIQPVARDAPARVSEPANTRWSRPEPIGPIRQDAPAQPISAPLNRPARRVKRPASRQRSGAIRKLLTAAFVLFCAVVLWRQFVVTSQGTVLVHLARHADGQVLVDGIASGSPDAPIPVTPGRHLIGLDAPGFTTQARSVRIAENRRETLTLLPVPKPASLVLDTVPSGAAITLDGRAIGRAPLRRTLGPGHHRIGAALSGFQPAVRTIEIAPGQASSLSIPLQAVPERTISIEAPAGQWSAPVVPGAGTRFTLLFRDAIRVRIAGRVILLQPGGPVELGAADQTGISVTAVGPAAVPVRLVIATDSSDAGSD